MSEPFILRTIYLPSEIDERLREVANQDNITKNQLIVNILSSAIMGKDPVGIVLPAVPEPEESCCRFDTVHDRKVERDG